MKNLVLIILLLLFLISASITSFIIYSYSSTLDYWGNKSQQDDFWLNPKNTNIEGFYETFSFSGEMLSIENNDDDDDSNFKIEVRVTDPNGGSIQSLTLPEMPESPINYYKTDFTTAEISKENFLGTLETNDFIQVTMQKGSGEGEFYPKIIEIYEVN